MNRVSTELIKDEQKFKDLRSEWGGLLKKSFTDSIFLTWEWLYSWWLAYSNEKDLNIICVRSEKNELIGIAPLFIHRAQYYRVPVVELGFLGDKASDRQDFIVDKMHPEVYEVLIGQILKARNWDIARLEQVPEWSALSSHEQFTKAYESEIASSLPFVNIASDWETYLKGLPKKFRKDLRNKYNILKREGEWNFEYFTNSEDLEIELEKIFQLEMDSKKMGAGYALFADIRAQDFHKMFSKYCLENGWLNISYLTLNGNPISYLIGYRYNNKYLAYNIAYVPEYYRASPGKLLLHETIKHCFENNLQEFDFLRGETYIKNLWSENIRTNYRIVLFNRGLKAKLLKAFVFSIRPIIKNQLSHGCLRCLLNRKS